MKWTSNLNKLEDNISWNEIWKNANQIISYIITSCYTPSQLPKWVRDDSTCIKCGTVEGTLLHLLWDCKQFKAFWFGITKQIMIHNNIDIPSHHNRVHQETYMN